MCICLADDSPSKIQKFDATPATPSDAIQRPAPHHPMTPLSPLAQTHLLQGGSSTKPTPATASAIDSDFANAAPTERISRKHSSWEQRVDSNNTQWTRVHTEMLKARTESYCILQDQVRTHFIYGKFILWITTNTYAYNTVSYEHANHDHIQHVNRAIHEYKLQKSHRHAKREQHWIYCLNY